MIIFKNDSFAECFGGFPSSPHLHWVMWKLKISALNSIKFAYLEIGGAENRCYQPVHNGEMSYLIFPALVCLLVFEHNVTRNHVILLTILTLGAGGRFDSHFWTQSGAPSPYLAFRAPPAVKLYMVLKACPAFNPYLALRAPLPPLSSYIWCWKRAPLRSKSKNGSQSAPPLWTSNFG